MSLSFEFFELSLPINATMLVYLLFFPSPIVMNYSGAYYVHIFIRRAVEYNLTSTNPITKTKNNLTTFCARIRYHSNIATEICTYHLIRGLYVRDANTTFSKKHVSSTTFSICNYNFLIAYRPLCTRSKKLHKTIKLMACSWLTRNLNTFSTSARNSSTFVTATLCPFLLASHFPQFQYF